MKLLGVFLTLLWALLLSIQPVDAGLLRGSSPQVYAGNAQLCSSTTFPATPANGYYCLNNTFGIGTLVNGVDFNMSISLYPSQFPNNTTMQWQFPATSCGTCGGYAYAYPIINYGASNYGNAWNVVGPWPEKLNAVSTLTTTYSMTLGTNLKSFDMLIDTFVTASPTSSDGSFVAELSVVPYVNQNFTWFELSNTSCHTFSAPVGEALVGVLGTEVLVYPTTGGCTTQRSILSGTLDLKEIYNYMVAQGLAGLTGNEYLRGIQYGPETQVPAVYNSGPYSGSVVFNSLSFNWQ